MASFHRPTAQGWGRAAPRVGAAAGVRTRVGWREMEHPLLEQDALQLLLQHARNVLTGTALIAGGIGGLQRFARSVPAAPGNLRLACLVAAGIGTILLLLNLCSGWRELARRREPLAVRAGAVLVYVGLSVLLTHAMVQLRAAL